MFVFTWLYLGRRFEAHKISIQKNKEAFFLIFEIAIEDEISGCETNANVSSVGDKNVLVQAQATLTDLESHSHYLMQKTSLIIH